MIRAAYWWLLMILPRRLADKLDPPVVSFSVLQPDNPKENKVDSVPIYDSSGLPINDGPGVSEHWVKNG